MPLWKAGPLYSEGLWSGSRCLYRSLFGIRKTDVRNVGVPSVWSSDTGMHSMVGPRNELSSFSRENTGKSVHDIAGRGRQIPSHSGASARYIDRPARIKTSLEGRKETGKRFFRYVHFMTLFGKKAPALDMLEKRIEACPPVNVRTFNRWISFDPFFRAYLKAGRLFPNNVMNARIEKSFPISFCLRAKFLEYGAGRSCSRALAPED